MKKLTLFLSLVSALGSAFSQNFAWAKTFGNTSSDQAFAITLDNSGNVYTTGKFVGAVDFDPGPGTSILDSQGVPNIFILKQDSLGNFVWVKQIGGGSQGYGLGLSVDINGNIYFTGYFNGTMDFDPGPGTYTLSSTGGLDGFVAKLDAGSNFVWAHQIGGMSNDACNSLGLDNFGNLYVCGKFNGTVDFDPGPGTVTLTTNGFFDAFITKFDVSGNFEWVKGIGSSGNETANSMTFDTFGNVYTIGSFQNTPDFDPGVGTFTLSSVGADDVFISKLDSLGNFIWAKSMGGAASESGTYVNLDANGNVYTTGYYSGPADFDPGAGTYTLSSVGTFISKLNASGNFIWAKALVSSGSSAGNSLATDNAGNMYLNGTYSGVTDLDPGLGTYTVSTNGVYFLKLDSNGDFVWARNINGGIYNTGNTLTRDAHGNIYTTGYFQDSCDFNTDVSSINTIASNGAYDVFVLKLSPYLVTGVEETLLDAKSEFIFYPNPNNGIFRVRAGIDMDLKFINNIGQLVAEFRVKNNEDTLINLPDILPGVYLVCGKTKYTSMTKKVVIAK